MDKMIDKWPRLKWFFFCLILLAFMAGCGGSSQRTGGDFLVRIDQLVVTEADFNNTLEIVKSAYSYEALQDPEVLAKIKARLLKQLTEELILARRAQEIGITVSDEELNKAVSNVTEDYPEGAFEQSLLENAIPFDTWKMRLKTGLLTEKVIERELLEKVVISPEEAAAYYQKYQPEEENTSSNTTAANVDLLKRLRREKAQEAYVDWIKELQQRYDIELNQPLWEELSK
ncbi:MAG: SurA N-terminal domain-containing protein [Thermodesulfobacteriota bacterium]